MRLADIALKGSQNILPRAERLANAWALDLRVPLFDRALAEAAFSLPPQLKLHGACEKYVLKLALQKQLPARDRLAPQVRDERADHRLGARAAGRTGRGAARAGRAGAARPLPRGVRRRGCVRGEPEPGETRRRRLGERLWALAMLEAWLRVFVDGRGRRPEGHRHEVHPLRPRQQVQGADRTRSAPQCKRSFAFEPHQGAKLTDQAFQNAIDRVSGDGKLRWGAEHLYYEIARRLQPRVWLRTRDQPDRRGPSSARLACSSPTRWGWRSCSATWA